MKKKELETLQEYLYNFTDGTFSQSESFNPETNYKMIDCIHAKPAKKAFCSCDLGGNHAIGHPLVCYFCPDEKRKKKGLEVFM